MNLGLAKIYSHEQSTKYVYRIFENIFCKRNIIEELESWNEMFTGGQTQVESVRICFTCSHMYVHVGYTNTIRGGENLGQSHAHSS